MDAIQSKLMFKQMLQKILQEDTLCFYRTFFLKNLREEKLCKQQAGGTGHHSG